MYKGLNFVFNIRAKHMLGLGKLKEAKQKAEELKAKLAGMDFEGKSYNDKVSIMCSGDKRFHSLEIDDSIFKIRTREEVQSMVLEAILVRESLSKSSLNKEEVTAYIRYRLAVAGQKQNLFHPSAIRVINRKSGGIPRLINLVCDRALLGAYSQSETTVSASHIKQAFNEIGAEQNKHSFAAVPKWVLAGVAFGAIFGALLIVLLANLRDETIALANTESEQTLARPQSETNKIEVPKEKAQPSALLGSNTNDIALPNTDAEGLTPEKRYGSQYIASLEYIAPPFNHKLAAYEAVLSAWGVAYTPKKNKLICDFAGSQGLACLHKQGNWRGLLQINRPVVMRLTNKKGQEFHIGVLEIEGVRLK